MTSHTGIKVASFAALAMLFAGCNVAFWGNLVVVLLTVGIFFGTLSLGRRADAASQRSRSSDRSA